VILLARVLRYCGEVWLGVTLGKESPAFLRTHVWNFAAGAVLLFVFLYLFIQFRQRGRGKANL
jgi:type VI protein secretion system component VasF